MLVVVLRMPACLCLQFVAPRKTINLSLEVVFHHFLWEPTEIDGMLPSLAPLLVECAGKREPLCEVAGMPKAKDPLELRKVQCGWCALSVSTWFDLTFASEHHAQQIDSIIPVWSMYMSQNYGCTCFKTDICRSVDSLSVRGRIGTDMTDTFNFNHSFGPSFFQPNKKVRWLFWG